MGYDASSYSVVGLVIPASKLLKSIKVKAFDHNLPNTMKFCPDTGRSLWRDQLTFPDGTEFPNHKVSGLEIISQSSEDEPTNPNTIFFVGKSKRANSDSDNKPFWSESEIAKAKIDIQRILSNYGLWDESKFGVYPVLYESC